MNYLRYSADEIRRILQLSENGLKDFFTRNRDFVEIEREAGTKESFVIKKNDFDKLMLLRVAEISSLSEKEQKLRNLSEKDKNSITKIELKSIISILEKITDEMKDMENIINNMGNRYGKLLTHHLEQQKHYRILENELELVKVKQNLMSKKLTDYESYDDEQETYRVLH
ncbi:MAG: hypothetical protein HQM10_07220 [Candidatus Riflebacteria bacterium]|nr:hypothetical protein [Candidatus Riflebacteria bacterium]